tara:strand:- start:37 stop:825 length:789 start_codon:yes stop_codon:yes gene_type:complete
MEMMEMNKNYNENCLDTMARMEDNFIDLTVTSPPYDDLRTYNGYSFDFESIAKELYRVTKQGGVVVWIVGDATVKGSETGTSFKQALFFKECGFNLHDTMIYQKKGAGAVGSNKCYIQNFEFMFVFSKDKIKNTNLIYDRENKKVCTTITNGNRTIDNADTERKYRTITTKKLGRRFNIWEVEQRNNQDKYHKLHPAPFPEQLANDHILSWSNEGDIVYDPFMGSGTTAKMAKINNRNWIGSEISEEYCYIANERIKETKPK